MRHRLADMSIAIRELARVIHLVDPYDRGDPDELRSSLDRVLGLWGKRSTPLTASRRIDYQKAQSGLSLALLELIGIRVKVRDRHPPARIETATTITLELMTHSLEELGCEVVDRLDVPVADIVHTPPDPGDVQLEIAGAKPTDLVSVPMMSRWQDRTTGEVWQICGAQVIDEGTDARVELWQGVGTPTTSTTWRKLIATHDRTEKPLK